MERIMRTKEQINNFVKSLSISWRFFKNELRIQNYFDIVKVNDNFIEEFNKLRDFQRDLIDYQGSRIDLIVRNDKFTINENEELLD